MQNKFDFENFTVYQKTEEAYQKILVILGHPKIDLSTKSQLKRACSSILLNIAEGSGRYSKRDKKNYYVIARGSVNECIAIIRCLRLELILSQEEFTDMYNIFLEIAKMLSALINTMMKKS